MKDRFNQFSTVIPIEGIIPIHLKKYTDAKIVEAARIYENDMPGSMLELQAELAIWRHKWSENFATIPVTSATGERSFSSLKLLFDINDGTRETQWASFGIH